METFQAIFTQLGVDSSLLPQFFIILIVFVIAHFLFLGKLQQVLEVREEKTIKLENSADDTLEKVSHMQNEYKIKVDDANRAALKEAADKKIILAQKYNDQYKTNEKEINQFVDQSRSEFSKELAGNKDKYLAESESLAQSLIQKILQ
jgi:F0F1-type ATP synthase membrane subunit b/b'